MRKPEVPWTFTPMNESLPPLFHEAIAVTVPFFELALANTSCSGRPGKTSMAKASEPRMSPVPVTVPPPTCSVSL